MPRKPPRPSGPGPDDAPVTVVTGTIRSQGEADALAVSLNVCDRTLILRAGATDLGQWPTASVTIKPATDRAFDFLAEGDHLIFEPDEPSEFLATGIVTTDTKRGRARRRSKEPKQPKPAKPAKPPKQARTSKPPKRRRKEADPTTQPADTGSQLQDATGAAELVPPEGRTPLRSRVAAKAADSVRSKLEQRDAARATAPKESKLRETMRQKRHQAWLFTLDQARRVDLFGLDRVPFKDDLRDDPNHEHTWDHRVAAGSGLGKHICIICGKIRL